MIGKCVDCRFLGLPFEGYMGLTWKCDWDGPRPAWSIEDGLPEVRDIEIESECGTFEKREAAP